MQHFTSYHWATLAIFAGVLAGIGQVICKSAGQAGIPPYTLIGIIGFVWLSSTIIFMTLGPQAGHVGLPMLPIMPFEKLWGLKPIIGLILVAGFIFWLENLARFDAINKAPLIVYVLAIVEISALVSCLLLDIAIYKWKGKVLSISAYEYAGMAFAIASITFFILAPKRV